MKRKIRIQGLLFSLLMSALLFGFAAESAPLLHLSPTGVGIAAVVLYNASLFAPKPSSDQGWGNKQIAVNGVAVEMWENHIEGNLFKSNEFILASVDESEYVIGGAVVHIPQAGAKANIVKNRSSLPATVVQRTDSDVTYPLDIFTSDPILITAAEEMQISYNKRESVLMEHEESLNEVIGDNILINWAPATNILRTSGIMNNDAASAPVAVGATASGATGNRLKFGLYDLKAVAAKMDKANVSKNDRYAVLSVDMANQLIDDMIITKYRQQSDLYDTATNELKPVMGFKIFTRSSALVYDNTGTPIVKAYGAASAADDNEGGLFWQKNGVGRAKGATKFFGQSDAPQYYGDVFSFFQKMGARKRRANEENVIAMVQTAA